MRFDFDRLLSLAGLDPSEAGVLNEAQNRSQHEDPGLDKEDGQGNQLNEIDYEPQSDVDEDHEDPTEEEEAAEESDDITFEVDDQELQREVLVMRQKRIQETKLRKVVREEIEALLEDSEEDEVYRSSSWVYGDNKPRNSRIGSVVLGLPSIGFE